MPIATTQYPVGDNVGSFTSQASLPINGAGAGDLSGSAVKEASDLNSDGKQDFILGAPNAFSGKGGAFMLLGQPNMGSAQLINLGALGSQTGASAQGISATDLVGSDVSGGGDYNNDGTPDVLIGAPGVSNKGGAVYIAFGSPGITAGGGPALPDGFTLTQATSNSALGASVDNLGDFDGDGVDDFIAGSPTASPNSISRCGRADIVFGGGSVSPGGGFAVSALSGSNGFKIFGSAASAQLGFVVKGVGDINVGARPDVAISEPFVNTNAGRICVIFGEANVGGSGTFACTSVNGANGFIIPGAASGDQLGGVLGSITSGDINGDNKRDLIFSAPFASPGGKAGAGIVYVVYGKSGLGSSGTLSLSFNGVNGFTISGLQAGDKLGTVSAGRDFNGDGKPDLAIGAQNAASGAGKIYVIFCGSGTIGGSGTFDLSTLNGQNGVVITGDNVGDHLGTIVSLVKDITGDGVDDLIATAPNASPGGLSQAGRSHVIPGDVQCNLLTNSLTIQKGQFKLLSSADLSATAINHASRDPSLQFTVSNVQHGQFELVSNPGVAITKFTQQQITSSQVKFVHDDSANAPTYSVVVGTGGIATHAPTPATITFVHLGPSLVNNNFIINQGQTRVLTSAFMSATSLDNTASNPSLIFTVTSVQHGRFEYVASPGIEITSFTQNEIQTGKVQFVSDGSPNAPRYNVTVSDGSLSTASQVGIISFNGAPVIINNSLGINQGQQRVLTSADLSALDPNDNAASLVFTVSQVQHGHFELVSAPGTPITSFTQGQVQSGDVQFIPDGSLSTPSFFVTVGDGKITTTPQATTISFNAAPSLNNNNLSISQRQTVVLTTGHLSATDPDNSANSLTFIVSAVQGGRFELVTAPGTPITSFTQGQIQAGSVQFVQDGTTTAPSFNVAVSDGKMTTAVQASTVIFFPAPVMVTNALTISQNQKLVLNATHLRATNANGNDPSLIFTVTSRQYGHFERVNNPGIEVMTFTQGDVQNGAVQFVTDGSINQPIYTLVVGDGKASSPAQAATITFNLAPVLTSNRLPVNQGKPVILTTSHLNASQPGGGSVTLTFTVTNVQNGRFELVSAPGIEITSFTLNQIQSADVQFIPDGSLSTPTFSVIVGNGVTSTAMQACVISFNATPALGNNNLSVSQGQTVVLSTSHLSGTDPDDNATALTFYVSGVQGGRFELVSAPGTAITSFTQGQIQAGQVQFVHDGTSTAPTFNVAVSDGKVATVAQASTITFFPAPVLVVNSITISQGQKLVLGTSHLSATNASGYDPRLIFTVSNVQYGRFEMINNPGTAITSFTQGDVQSGAVRFVADGSNNPPSYTIVVGDGRANAPAQASTITFHLAPVLTSNNVAINQGKPVVLTASNFDAMQPGGAQGTLTFVVGNVQHGHFEFVDAPGLSITSFTTADIQSANVQFIPDGSLSTPSFDIYVKNNVTATLPQSAVVSFNAAPTLGNNNLSIGQGQTIILSTSNLSATDPDDDGTTLTFLISGVRGGRFELVSAPGVEVTSFTQGQVQAGQVQFVHDGSTVSPTFNVAVSDGKMATVTQVSIISFNTAPVLNVNSFSLNQGKLTLVTSSNLSATDATGANPNLIFTVSNVKYGRFELVSNPGVGITSFTQGQIQNSAVQFVPDKSTNPPSFSVSVSNGKATLAPQASTVSFKLAPVITKNALALNQNEPITITTDHIDAVNSDDNSVTLTFTVSNVQHGQFELIANPGTVITSFTRSQIVAGDVRFVPDNSGIAPSYGISVSNGRAASVAGTQMAIVEFVARPTLVQNHLSIINSQPLILTTSDLSATDPKMPKGRLVFTASGVSNGYFEDINAPGTPLLSFEQQLVIDGRIRFVPDASGLQPAYNISVSNGILSSLAAPAVININAIEAGDSGGLSLTAKGSITAAAVSTGLFLVRFGIMRVERNRLDKAVLANASDTEHDEEKFNEDVLMPIAKAVFKKVSVTGVGDIFSCRYFNACNRDRMSEYLSTVRDILNQLSDQGISLNFAEKSSLYKARLTNEIARQVKLQTVGNYSRYNPRWALSFFKAEITPEQLKAKVPDIVSAVAVSIGKTRGMTVGIEMKDMRLNPLLAQEHKDHGQRLKDLESEVSQLRRRLVGQGDAASDQVPGEGATASPGASPTEGAPYRSVRGLMAQ